MSTKIPTLYSDYQEVVVDLNIYGKIISTPQQSLDAMRQSMYEEFRVQKPMPTMEQSRYELSRRVSEQYLIKYNEELKLQFGESLVEFDSSNIIENPDFRDLSPLIPEVQQVFSYEQRVTDSLRDEIIQKYSIETGEDLNFDVHQTEMKQGTVKEDESLIVEDDELERLRKLVYGEYEDISSEPENTLVEIDEGVSLEDSDEDLSSNTEDTDTYDEASDNSDEEVLDEDEYYEDDDEYGDDFGEDEDGDDIDYDEESDDGDYEDSESDDEYYDDDDVDYDESDEDEDEEYSEDEYSDEDDYSDDEESYDEDEDFDDGSDEEEYADDGSDEDDFDDDDIDYENEEVVEDEDLGVDSIAAEDDIVFDEPESTPEPEKVETIKEQRKPNPVTSFSIDDEDNIFGVAGESEVISQDTVKQFAENLGGTVKDTTQALFDMDISDAITYLQEEHTKPIDAVAREPSVEEKPTDLRTFLRQHPRCSESEVLKYFSRKELQKNKMMGKIVIKNGIVRLS